MDLHHEASVFEESQRLCRQMATRRPEHLEFDHVRIEDALMSGLRLADEIYAGLSS